MFLFTFIRVCRYVQLRKARVNQKVVKSSWKEYFTFTCFKSLPRIWICLAFYLATFCRVYSNSKEVPYLPWQNEYSNLKITCHCKPKIFLWTQLLENVLLARCFISVTAALAACISICFLCLIIVAIWVLVTVILPFRTII